MKHFFPYFLFIQTIVVYSYHETVPLEIVAQYVPDNPVIVEAGAHHGQDTIRMSHRWPGGIIYAFEPLPLSFMVLQKKVRQCSNIICFHYALAEQNKLANFYFDDNPQGDNGASSLFKPESIMQSNYSSRPLIVHCITLDEWVRNYNISHIDFLWLDMEGGELAALKASPTIMKTVKAIHLEVNFINFWEGIPLYDEVKRWLEAQGFIEAWRSLDLKWQGNAFFVRNTYEKTKEIS